MGPPEPNEAAYYYGADFYEADSSESVGTQIEGIIDLLNRRKWMIALSLLMMAGVAAVYTWVQEPAYRASSFVMVNLGRGGSAAFGTPPDEQNFFASNDRPIEDEIFVLENSYPLAEEVAERLHETRVIPGGDTLLPILQTEDGDVLSVEQVANRLSRYVDFAPVSKSDNIIQLAATSPVPEEAVLIANLYTEEYVSLTREAKSTRLARSGEFLQGQLARRRAELRQAEEQLASYMKAERNAGLSREENHLVTRIAELEAQQEDKRLDLQLRRNTLKSLENELAEMSSGLARDIVAGVNQQIQDLRDEIDGLEARKEAIERRYPDVGRRNERTKRELGRIDQEIQQLENEAERLADRYVQERPASEGDVASLKREILREESAIEALQTQIDVIGDRLVQYQAELQGLPAQSMELAQLQRQREYAEQMHRLVEERLLDARLAGELEQGTGYVRVIREAQRSKPVGNSWGRNLMMGALLGLLIGVGLAVMRDKVDNRIYKPEQLRAQGYSEIGVVPNMQPLIEEDFGGKKFLEQNGRQVATSLVSLHQPASTVAEAYRNLRINIQFGIPDMAVRTMLVTSPGVGEGKSVTAANLAVFMARAGRRTLLIDADLHRPQVHQLFGVTEEQGLLQLLRNGTSFDAEKARTPIRDLFLITAGRTYEGEEDASLREDVAANGVDELLGSRRMQELLIELQDQFDLVILDTPPVLAATDAVLLSTQCDAALVVTRAGVTKEGDLDHTMEALEGVGATVLGVLLNGFDLSMAYGYKYSYGHYSKYGPYSKYKYGYQDPVGADG